MIEKVVDRMYAEIDDNRFLEVTYANGDKEVMYFRTSTQGDDPERRRPVQKYAIKSVLETGQRGLRIQHLLDSIVDEFAENEDLPNTTNPDDWARISGRRANGSSTSARWSRARAPVPAGPSTPSPTWASTSDRNLLLTSELQRVAVGQFVL